MAWAAPLGVLIVAVTAASVMRALVIPRGLSSRIAERLEQAVQAALLVLARPVRSYEAKDNVLAFQAPAALLAQLAVWLGLFFFGYALVLWSMLGSSFAEALRQSGSSMFTLGFAVPADPAPTAVHFAAAATGMVVVALQIAYLPVLYAAFSRRESLVTMLRSRAGAPAWGPEILVRHHLVLVVDNLPAFYADWERWAADVSESHTTYPVLVGFRSPDPLRNWVVALLAVLDSAALWQALCPGAASSESRLCLRMGFTCLRNVADVLGIAYDPDPRPDDPLRLSFEEFADGVARLEKVGFPVERTAAEAWPHFRGWRVNYEAVGCKLADRVLAVPAPWSGERRRLGVAEIDPRRPAHRTPDAPDAEPPSAYWSGP